MIIKPFERREADLVELRRLADMPRVENKVRKEIEAEIAKILAGDKVEREVAYEIDFHFGDVSRRNHVVLHDLRLEFDGRVAQIDHLMINRFLECYVVESKSFLGGIEINEHGEFTTFYGGRPVAVPSPVTQNDRHISVLKSVESANLFATPRRLGIPLRMSYKPVIAVGKRSRIRRPKKPVPGLERLIKADQFAQMYAQDINKIGNPLEMAKLIGSDTLEEFGKSIADQHRPIFVDWAGRFRISSPRSTSLEPPSLERKASDSKYNDEEWLSSRQRQAAKKKSLAHHCAVCGKEVDSKVVFYCRIQKERFGARILCREHQ